MPSLISPAIPSGPYSATWNGTDIGLFEGVIRLQQNVNGLPVRASQWGQTVIDYILSGGGAFGVFVLKEWTSASKRFLWPFGNGISGTPDLGLLPAPGVFLSSYSAPLVLTALAGTPAATYGPVTRTYPYVASLPGHNFDLLFGPMERNTVVACAVLPQTDGSTRQARLFTDT